MTWSDGKSSDDLFLDFVHERDHPCPRCGYNLRNLTTPVCPECEERLLLKVGVEKLRLHYLIAALAPGMFSAIATGLFIVMCFLEGPPPPGMWEPWAVVGFLSLSGVLACGIALRTRRFLQQSDGAQATWAIILWLIHIGVLVLLVSTAL